MQLSRRISRILIYIVLIFSVFAISWKILLALHISSMQKNIKQYLGDGKIEYIQAPPVPFSGFHDGIRIIFPETGGLPTRVKYSLKGLPKGRVYYLLFRVPQETNYIDMFPGNIRIEVFRNGELSQAEDSTKTVLRNSYAIYNDFYFDSERGSKLFQEKTDICELLLVITYSGKKSIQPILQSGGEL